MRIYLASRSPRRRELLAQIGVGFDAILLGIRTQRDEVDESPLPGESPAIYVERVARSKAKQGVHLVNARKLPLRPVLAADTIIELDGEIVGKPKNISDAEQMLRRFSGRMHRVLTGVVVMFQQRVEYRLSVSRVRFRVLEDEEIRHYLRSGEALNKAGAYGIQGKAALFVKHIHGSHSGIMGLPLCETGELLKSFGCPLLW